MTTDTRTDLQRNCDHLAARIDLLVDLAYGNVNDHEPEDVANIISDEGGDPEEFERDEDDGAFDAEEVAEWARTNIEESVLDVEVHGKRSLGSDEWEVSHLEVVFGTGGPHLELNTREGRICGYWGGEVAYRSVDSQTNEYFEEWAEQ